MPEAHIVVCERKDGGRAARVVVDDAHYLAIVEAQASRRAHANVLPSRVPAGPRRATRHTPATSTRAPRRDPPPGFMITRLVMYTREKVVAFAAQLRRLRPPERKKALDHLDKKVFDNVFREEHRDLPPIDPVEDYEI